MENNIFEDIFIKQPKDMYSREKENNIMGMIDIKEKIIKTLGDFLERNKEYTVEVYISNLSTNSIIERMYITDDPTFKADDRKVVLEWDNRHDIMLNNISILFDEVLVCYDEKDEYGQQMVFVILKCGVSIDFECCGLRLE